MKITNEQARRVEREVAYAIYYAEMGKSMKSLLFMMDNRGYNETVTHNAVRRMLGYGSIIRAKGRLYLRVPIERWTDAHLVAVKYGD